MSSSTHPITNQVLERLHAENPRTEEILRQLIVHLHSFVTITQLTSEEWSTAIDFLTRTGQKCDIQRQEFILLSDVLGVSMLVDSIQHQSQPTTMPNATESTVQGPFHAPSNPATMGDHLAKGPERTRGEPTIVRGVVRDAVSGRPIENATLDVWQSDDLGRYDVQISKTKNLRATFTTNADGQYNFRTIKPASYPVPTDGPVGELLEVMGRHPMRPAHIHFLVQAPGYSRLVTHLFVKGDPYLESDAVFGVKDSLIVEFVKKNGVYEVDFDVILVPQCNAMQTSLTVQIGDSEN